MISTLPKTISLRTVAVTGIMLLAAFLGSTLHPTFAEGVARPALATVVPKQIGEWRELPNPMLQVDITVPSEATSRDQPYDDVVSRTYVNPKGDQIMVALAYGARQRQEVKIHRPELCYPAQGWRVLKLEPVVFPVKTPSGESVIGHRLLTQRDNSATEAVSYWIRIGNSYSDSPWVTRLAIMKEGLQGRMTDGILVRVSQRLDPGQSEAQVFERQEKFAAQLVASTRSDGQALLLK